MDSDRSEGLSPPSDGEISINSTVRENESRASRKRKRRRYLSESSRSSSTSSEDRHKRHKSRKTKKRKKAKKVKKHKKRSKKRSHSISSSDDQDHEHEDDLKDRFLEDFVENEEPEPEGDLLAGYVVKKKKQHKGPPISENLVKLYVSAEPSKDFLDDLQSSKDSNFLMPENLEEPMKEAIPKVNIEMWKAMFKTHRTLDRKIQEIQRNVQTSTIAICRAIDCLNDKEKTRKEACDQLLDTIQMNKRINYEMCMARRIAVFNAPKINKRYRNLISEEVPISDGKLFGGNLSKELENIDVSKKLETKVSKDKYPKNDLYKSPLTQDPFNNMGAQQSFGHPQQMYQNRGRGRGQQNANLLRGPRRGYPRRR